MWFMEILTPPEGWILPEASGGSSLHKGAGVDPASELSRPDPASGISPRTQSALCVLQIASPANAS